jgi:DNA-binding SARP family transcriptional activator/WD40 repeat protein/energy-coupling factor transporter ATP-binding protein EcfA2
MRLEESTNSVVRYRALGPISVQVDDDYVKLGGLRQRIVLAVLLHSANRLVTQDALIDSVWSGEPPEAARATVQSYIYNLRRAIGSDSIVRRADGYLIEVDANTFDVLAFEERVEKGMGLLESDPEAARAALLEGLGMWFGTAYGGIDHPELQVEIQRLDEMRVNAIETRIEADLAIGRAGELVGELETLVRDHPFRERFWAQLMLALYRAGRQAESLRAYQQARSRLVDDLGIEPGSDLQQLEQQILDQDPSLLIKADRAGSTPGGDRSGSIRGYELRDVVGRGDFGVVYRAYQPSISREVAIKVIQPAYANDRAFVARFEREAQIAANLEHPHILPLHDYWRDPTGAYLVMPLMRGGSLDGALQHGGWSLGPALRLLDQVGSALSHAHRRGVIHRDLKPGNILLDEDGNTYLSDFGMLTALGDDGSTVPVSRRHIAPEEASGGGATVRSDIYALGALTFHLLSGVPFSSTSMTDLSEARPDIPTSLAAVVARATAIDPRERFSSVDEYLRELRREAGADVVAGSGVVETVAEPTRNPYKGLRAFVEKDAVDFHGRTALVDDLLERVESHRLVTVVGPSGSGKSSLVRAGLIPALREGRILGSSDWLITDMFPGSYPFEELEGALSRVAVRAPTGMRDELAQPDGLLRVSKQILPGDDSTLLIVIDQFEELFSAVRSEVTRRLFLESLIAVASDERSRVRVVTTIRADFLDRPLVYADFAEAISDGIITVGPPTRDGLARAVAAPAQNVGIELEEGLIGRIIADVEGQPGALPLLQYALTEMFAHRHGSTLTIAGYEATGGVAGALGRRAEEVYEGLSTVGQAAAHHVFLRLVSVDASGAVTRRRARQAELVSLAVDRAGLESALQAFAGFRLLTFDRDPVTRGPTVEVAHEALLTEWSRLAGWIEEARESLMLARRVSESTREWIDSNEDPSYLLRGVRLEDVETWASRAHVVLTGDESRYIAAGVAHRASELDTALRRRRRVILALAVGLLLVGSLAVVAFLQRGEAQLEALESRVRALAAASGSHVDENPELALLIAIEAFDESVRDGGSPMSEAVSAMGQAIAEWRLVSRFPAGEIVFPVAAPDGSLLAVSSKVSPRDVDVFDTEGLLVGTLPGPDHPSVAAWAVAFNPDGQTIAVTYAASEGEIFRSVPDGVPDVVIFDLETMSSVTSLETDRGWMQVSHSPDGARLALSGGREVRIVDWANGTEVSRFEGSSSTGHPVFLDGDSVIVPVEGSGFTTFSSVDGSLEGHLQIANLNQTTTAVDASHSRLAYRAGDRIRVSEIATGEVVFDVESSSVLSVALDSDGTHLAYSGFDSDIAVVSLDRDGQDLQLSGTYENVFSLAFVGSERLLSYGEDALLWDVSPEGLDELGGIALAEPQWGYQISPDERFLAYRVSTNQGGDLPDPNDGLRLVDLESDQETVLSQNEWQAILAGLRLVSPDFTMVGSLTQDGESTMRLLPGWDVVREFDRCRSPLAVTPDNSLVVLGGWGCVADDPPESAESAVVDIETGTIVLPIPYQYLFSAEFNPEGIFAGGRFLVATDQVTVEVWDMSAGESLGSFDRSDRDEFGFILVVAFDPTGRYVIGGTSSGTVWVVDLERVLAGEDMANALVFSRQAHTGAAPLPAMNGDGIVATVGFDDHVRLWDVDSGDLLLEFESDIGVPVVQFTPDGEYLLYPDGLSIRRLPVDPFRLRDLAEELLTRDFLADECARYAAQSRCEALTG